MIAVHFTNIIVILSSGAAEEKGITSLRHFKLKLSFPHWHDYDLDYKEIVPDHPFTDYLDFVCRYKDNIV